MSDSDRPPAPDRLTDLLDEGVQEDVVACIEQLAEADTEDRKRALRAAREVAEERPGVFDGLAAPFSVFLTDAERAVKLTTAKLFVTVARSEAKAVRPAVDALADRLADDDEFYYVRARCAEALGYVALDAPGDVNDPEILADFRIGLEFDEPEVKEKLAKALAYVALGDPDRLGYQIESLAAHLDDDNELVRYHLTTALVAVSCEHPRKLADAEAALRERLTDENPYVQGRAAEALGVLAESDVEIESSPNVDVIGTEAEETPSFLTERVRFCQRRLADELSGSTPSGVGTIESVRDGTEEVVEAMTAAEEGVCPHCGLALAPSGPPVCPRCGAPH